MLTAHFIDIGQGNMVLLRLSTGTTILCDCNVTTENEARVLRELSAALFPQRHIDVFMNSHREADHMRGVQRVHATFPISRVWDSGVTGGDTGSTEYREYMACRLAVQGCETVQRGFYYDYGTTRVRVMNAENDDVRDNPNAQSVVLKVENWQGGRVVNSLMLAGDSDVCTWERSILPRYRNPGDLASTILMGGHHGSDTFVREASGRIYLDHLQAISPGMTILSVGEGNGYGHPDPFALWAYNTHSLGAQWVIGGPPDLKVLRTDLHGSMRLQLNDDAGWVVTWTRPIPAPLPSLATLLNGLPSAARPPAPPTLLTGLGTLGRLTDQGLTPPSLAGILGPPHDTTGLLGLSGLSLSDLARAALSKPPTSFPADILAEILRRRPPGSTPK